MARYNKIDLGPAVENNPQTAEAIPTVAVTPGTIVLASGAVATATNARQGDQLYIADHNWCAGQQVSDDNAANETMIMQLPLPRKKYAALLANGENVTAKDTALKVGASGLLEIATLGTDYVSFRADEVYNNNTGSAQLIIVRPVTV